MCARKGYNVPICMPDTTKLVLFVSVMAGAVQGGPDSPPPPPPPPPLDVSVLPPLPPPPSSPESLCGDFAPDDMYTCADEASWGQVGFARFRHPPRPRFFRLPSKPHFGLANVYMCVNQAKEGGVAPPPPPRPIIAFTWLSSCFASLSAARPTEVLVLAVQCNQSWMLVTNPSLPYGYCAYTCGRCPPVTR
jgi:hypothetical protein